MIGPHLTPMLNGVALPRKASVHSWGELDVAILLDVQEATVATGSSWHTSYVPFWDRRLLPRLPMP